ncbi:MAG: ribosome biogenesis GTPase Der [Patescibacteria group bacterium]
MTTHLPKIAIVGRANVGKSTLFNRIIEKQKALVSALSGTTRDRNIAVGEWCGSSFELIDTGGLDIDLNEETHQDIAKGVIRQALGAIKSADLILFLVDLNEGATPSDRKLAKELIIGGFQDKIILVGNKAETARNKKYDAGVYKLGLGEPMAISAASGSGVGDLLDLILTKIKKVELAPAEDAAKPIKVALLGRPNVGKSSILNSILGEERVIVSAVAHTTREAHDIVFNYNGQDYLIIDTAGLRRQAKVDEEGLEKKSIGKTLDAIHNCDVAVLVTEVNQKIDMQDKKITQEILESGKSVIIVANKWDLIEDKDTDTINSFVDYYRRSFPYLWWAPLIFVSAKDNLRTKKILELISEVAASRKMKISDSQLDKFLKQRIKQHHPSRGKGLKNPYLYEIKQVSVNPPRLEIMVNDPAILHFSYIRFLQNNLREQFKIIGTPIQIELKKWSETHKKEAEAKLRHLSQKKKKVKK